MKNCNWGGKQEGRGGLLPPSLYVKRGPVTKNTGGWNTDRNIDINWFDFLGICT